MTANLLARHLFEVGEHFLLHEEFKYSRVVLVAPDQDLYGGSHKGEGIETTMGKVYKFVMDRE